MHVVATAGHVDHGKSTLVRRLTGSDPDRLAEEHERGLSIRLGYCWTDLPGVGPVAFVDVPGHERFVATMLAGVGEVPAVLFVVAADDPWMPQAAEHLAALDALGVSRGVLAITRCDLADPAPALAQARHALARTSLHGVPEVRLSGHTGDGLEDLRTALAAVVGSLPEPDPAADVRWWVDRCFTVKGTGTVATGTLAAGTVGHGDVLACGPRPVRVRAVQRLGRAVDRAQGVARVALNLGGVDVAEVRRAGVLTTPGAWQHTDLVDVRLSPAVSTEGTPPQRPLLHVGATATAVHHRPLGRDVARLRLERGLPLRVGDRALLRDPGSRRLWGVRVLDPVPPPLGRRGAAARRADELAESGGVASFADELRRRGWADAATLRRIGVTVPEPDEPGEAGETGETGETSTAHAGVLRAGDWLLDAARVPELAARLERLVAERAAADPLSPGVPVSVAARELGLPAPDLVPPVVRNPLVLDDGVVRRPDAERLPAAVEEGVRRLEADLADAPFAAPDAPRLAELGLDAKAIAAAARAGRLLRLGEQLVLLPGADVAAAGVLRQLPQPVTASQARRAWGTTRRVALPLLDHLDRVGLTRRLPDDRRVLTGSCA